MQHGIGLHKMRLLSIKTVSNNQRRIHLPSREKVSYIVNYIGAFIRAHQAIIVLTIFVLVNNIAIVRSSYEVSYASTSTVSGDPYEIAETVRIIAPYIPQINIDPDQLAFTLEEQSRGTYISANPLSQTLPSQTDEPTTNSETRTSDTKYKVQIGDTLSGIGAKFNLKLASLRVKNNLSDVDSIKPGQDLIIPAVDLSEKTIKAAEDRKKAKALADATKSIKKIAKGVVHNLGLITPIHFNNISRRLVDGHTGIDYCANVGTPVAAAADGTVAQAFNSGWNGGYGDTVLISHGGGMTTRYGHMSRVIVSGGQHVDQGQIIGYSGNTGRSTGPHLHFEVRVAGRAVDPGT